MASDDELPAGDFATWLAAFQAALRDEGDSDVPCDGCTACCSSGQFVHIGPDETDTLAHIPAELRFPAPGLPGGHVVLGYDEHGRCPMLADRRVLDLRAPSADVPHVRLPGVRAAAGVDPAKEPLGARVRRWRFSYPTVDDRQLHTDVRAAARLAGERSDAVTTGTRPRTPAAIAVHAVEIMARHSSPPRPRA